MNLLLSKQNVFLHGKGESRSWHLTKLVEVTHLINYWQSQTWARLVDFLASALYTVIVCHSHLGGDSDFFHPEDT